MRTKPDYWYRQSAAVPVREDGGRVEILLVTSMGTGKWILPKGIVEPGLTPAESAAKEAWEEAGVKGAVRPRPLGTYKARKWGGETEIEVYRLDVDFVAEDWLEAGTRKRKWFSLKEAARAVTPPHAAGIVKSLMEPFVRLTLVRHAKSSWKKAGIADFERPLAGRGKLDAPKMGKRLAAKGIKPDLIVTSPAKRARKTARLMAEELGIAKASIKEEPEIYEACVTVLLAVVRDFPDGVHHAMLVGHNPGLTELANLFLPEPLEDLPTAAVVSILFPCHHWKEVEAGEGKLLEYDFPKREESPPETVG